MLTDTHNTRKSEEEKNWRNFGEVCLARYLERWGGNVKMEARKYSDKFMFLVNLLHPTSLSQVIFPQNMRNLSKRYFGGGKTLNVIQPSKILTRLLKGIPTIRPCMSHVKFDGLKSRFSSTKTFPSTAHKIVISIYVYFEFASVLPVHLCQLSSILGKLGKIWYPQNCKIGQISQFWGYE